MAPIENFYDPDEIRGIISSVHGWPPGSIRTGDKGLAIQQSAVISGPLICMVGEAVYHLATFYRRRSRQTAAMKRRTFDET
ncbi:MAG: hypothetical protein WA383_06755 [Terriglobales bacterium]